jgi:hypothetical protein
VPAPEAALQAKDAPEGRFWITGKGVRALRKRLGLTKGQEAGRGGDGGAVWPSWPVSATASLICT